MENLGKGKGSKGKGKRVKCNILFDKEPGFCYLENYEI